jgi:hypothetical protein
MLFIVIERFEGNNMLPVYERVNQKGRGLPDGLKYINSWIEPNFARCFQLMECEDLKLFQQWVLHWQGTGASFEIVPVVESSQAREVVAPSEQAVNPLAPRVTPPLTDVLPQAAPASGRRSCRMLNDRFLLPKYGNLEVGSGSFAPVRPRFHLPRLRTLEGQRQCQRMGRNVNRIRTGKFAGNSSSQEVRKSRIRAACGQMFE